jgi:hypothetical protein
VTPVRLKCVLLILISVLAWIGPRPAMAIGLTLPSIDDLISPSLQKSAIRTAGVLAAHRPYQPATPLGTALGLESMLEVTLVQMPESLFDELAAAGLGANFAIRTLPVAKLHVHKGINPRMDLGASYFKLLKYSIYGADLKWAFWVPEEGPTWAFRLCYSQSDLDYLRTKAWSPQLIVSRKLSFAEAYLGAEYTWITGRIVGSQTQDLGPPVGPVTVAIDIRDIPTTSASTFLGLGLRIPGVGFKIALEGAYSFVKSHSLGLQLGTSW